MLYITLFFAILLPGLMGAAAEPVDTDQELRALLDAPLLFTKRHSYSGIHIYDTYYKWPPGGGGIYVLENPAAPRNEWVIRPVVDPATPNAPGDGIYDDPNLHWDGTRFLFTFKGEPHGSTSIWEVNVDGTGLRQLTDPSTIEHLYQGSHGGQHDVYPAYLPDDRIVFLSTRPGGLVPCANTGVSIMHVMNADGSNIHPISVNNVDEFDPAVMPDGRILFGRWEYIDKNALTIQSLWNMNPDGTQETALYANNMVFPEAILDARPVPGTHLIVGTFAKHNAPPRGAIALVDPTVGKNNPAAVINLEYPDEPLRDTGNSCEPWPVTQDVFLFSGRPPEYKRNIIEMIDTAGRRIKILEDSEICLHSPMLIKPQTRPPVIPSVVNRNATTGTFIVQDIYQGLDGVARGEVKHLRVLEETSRISSTNMGGSPYNQVFLISAALGWSPKIFHGIVPVEEDGSVHFEAPSGRALYFQALDEDSRIVHSMRTFVQAAPGAARSCVGCHESRETAPATEAAIPAMLHRPPKQLQPESWGSGHLDYPGMIQPILDRHCVRCHGGEEGIANGMDLSGGWTEHFNISYENLVNRSKTQLVAHWIAGIDSMNATAFWSSQIFPPRAHGSGAAPLAELLVSGHHGRIPELTREERDLLMAWMDTNGLYHGTWNATPAGCAIPHWNQTRDMLVRMMRYFDCLQCHGDGEDISFFENDWINLERPEFSRILRAPLAKGDDGHGLAWCRDRKVEPDRQRIHLLRGGYGHAVTPIEAYPTYERVRPDRSGAPVTPFASTADPKYQAMLGVIRAASKKTLENPRVDMPGAQLIAGECRMFIPPPVPEHAPPPVAMLNPDGSVRIQWEQSAELIGLEAELHRSDASPFAPTEETRIARTPLNHYTDVNPAPEQPHYAIIIASDAAASQPAYVSLETVGLSE